MAQRKKTTLLIVDDSKLFRCALEAMLARVDDIEVIGSVWNGKKAVEFIRKTPPDLVTLDLEMPEMDGLGALKAIQQFNDSRPDDKPVGVIMISSHTRKGADITVRALEMGAFDFIAKPGGGSLAANISDLSRQLLTKIRLCSSRRITSQLLRNRSECSAPPAKKSKPVVKSKPVRSSGSIRAILIGVSTGGPKALMGLMPLLCDKVDLPILIAQHMPATFTQSLAKSLDAKCRHTVTEGSDNARVEPGHVYIAPGGRHMELRRKGTDVVIKVHDAPPEKGCRPSVNALFRSGAQIYGRDLIAVILTGMGEDGTDGARILKDKGAVILAQDEASSVVWGMPGSAAKAGYVDRLLSLGEIPEAIGVTLRRAGK